MTKQLDRPCPICDCPTGEVLHHPRFESFAGDPLTRDCDVVCCTRCGFAFADTALGQEDYDRFYTEQSKYIDSAHSTGAGASAMDRARLEATARTILEAVPKDARILDVGCANGGLLRCLKEQGATQLAGVDPSPICAEIAARAAGCETFSATMADLASGQKGHFDCLVLTHVLEHVRDLQPCLASLRGVVRTGTMLYVEVPDATRYRDHVFAPFQDFNTEHINHFSTESMKNLLRVAGWTPLRAGIREMFTAPGKPYPAFYVLTSWTGTGEDDGGPVIERDTALRPALLDYIEKSTELWRKVDRQLAEVLALHGTVILWGAGQLAMKLLSETCLREARLAAIVDSSVNRHGQSIHGVTVIPPRELQSGPVPIVITSMLHEDAIEEAIVKLGLKNPLVRLGG